MALKRSALEASRGAGLAVHSAAGLALTHSRGAARLLRAAEGLCRAAVAILGTTGVSLPTSQPAEAPAARPPRRRRPRGLRKDPGCDGMGKEDAAAFESYLGDAGRGKGAEAAAAHVCDSRDPVAQPPDGAAVLSTATPSETDGGAELSAAEHAQLGDNRLAEEPALGNEAWRTHDEAPQVAERTAARSSASHEATTANLGDDQEAERTADEEAQLRHKRRASERTRKPHGGSPQGDERTGKGKGKGAEASLKEARKAEGRAQPRAWQLGDPGLPSAVWLVAESARRHEEALQRIRGRTSAGPRP